MDGILGVAGDFDVHLRHSLCNHGSLLQGALCGPRATHRTHATQIRASSDGRYFLEGLSSTRVWKSSNPAMAHLHVHVPTTVHL